LAGAGAAEAAGRFVDGIFKKKENSVQEKILEEYSTGINEANYAKKEEELMNAFEKDQNRLKMQNFKRAAAMAGAAALTTGVMQGGKALYDHFQMPSAGGAIDPAQVGGGKNIELEKSIPPDSPDVKIPIIPDSEIKGPTIPTPEPELKIPVIPEGVPKAKLDYSGEMGKVREVLVSNHQSAIPDAPKVIEQVMDNKVPVSSRGFIQTIMDLKDKLRAEYDGQEIPENIKTNILDKSSVELAKELHLYDPDNHLSGVGFKGDNLHMDTNGHLIYEHANGKPEILLDTNTGEVHNIEVKLVPEHIENLAANETPKVPNLNEVPAIQDVPSPINIPVSEISSHTFEQLPVSSTHVPFNNLFVDVLEKEGSKVMSFNGQEIAHEHIFGTGKLLELDDKFQDGAQYKNIREAFITAFEKQPTNLGGGQLIDAKVFEGGKIYIVQGVDNNPAALKVLLNGKEIAKGVLIGDKPKLDLASNLKASWFVETVYERAFKVAKASIKSAMTTNNVVKK